MKCGWTGDPWVDIPLWVCVLYTLFHTGKGLFDYYFRSK